MQEIEKMIDRLFEFAVSWEDPDPKDLLHFYQLCKSLHVEAESMLQDRSLELADSSPFFREDYSPKAKAYGQCGDQVFWKIVDDVLYIGGTGDMWDFNTAYYMKDAIHAPWAEWCGHFRTVVIHNGVTSIGATAFSDMSFHDILIPSSVTVIKEAAFGDTFISKLVLPNTLHTVEPYIISADPCRVSSLTVAVDIPNIMPDAFYTRYLAPDEIILTGKLPEDLSALVASGLFAFFCPKLAYPKEWDTEEETFFDRLCKALSCCGQEEERKHYKDAYFEKLKRTLNPY